MGQGTPNRIEPPLPEQQQRVPGATEAMGSPEKLSAVALRPRDQRNDELKKRNEKKSVKHTYTTRNQSDFAKTRNHFIF